MSVESIKNILKDKIGLYTQSIGESSVLSAIETRMQIHGLRGIDRYHELLIDSRMEFDALVEEIVVPETWFFRYKKSFKCIGDHISTKVKQGSYSLNSSRILSFPCSTGEEPYSILIELSEKNIPLANIIIDAVDISKRSLKKAEIGQYAQSAFREMDDSVRQRHFSSCDGGYKIHEHFRRKINFKQNNFLVGSISPQPAYYDVILCRNLLIYFDSDLQQIALEKLHRALKPDGILILGHAESSTINSQYFCRYGDEREHVFQRVKNSMKSAVATSKNFNKQPSNSINNTEWRCLFSENSKDDKQKQDADKLCRQFDSVGDISFRLLEKMISNGQYRDAEILIDKRLQKNKNDSDAHFLLALIEYKQDKDSDAESILKKVLYLEPRHERSIELLQSMARKNADMISVKKYDKRLKRIRSKK